MERIAFDWLWLFITTIFFYSRLCFIAFLGSIISGLEAYFADSNNDYFNDHTDQFSGWVKMRLLADRPLPRRSLLKSDILQ
jgi:hypothetical protein